MTLWHTLLNGTVSQLHQSAFGLLGVIHVRSLVSVTTQSGTVATVYNWNILVVSVSLDDIRFLNSDKVPAGPVYISTTSESHVQYIVFLRQTYLFTL